MAFAIRRFGRRHDHDVTEVKYDFDPNGFQRLTILYMLPINLFYVSNFLDSQALLLQYEGTFLKYTRRN